MTNCKYRKRQSVCCSCLISLNWKTNDLRGKTCWTFITDRKEIQAAVSARALFLESGGTWIIHFHPPLNLIFKFIVHLFLLYVIYTASHHEAIDNIWIYWTLKRKQVKVKNWNIKKQNKANIWSNMLVHPFDPSNTPCFFLGGGYALPSIGQLVSPWVVNKLLIHFLLSTKSSPTLTGCLAFSLMSIESFLDSDTFCLPFHPLVLFRLPDKCPSHDQKLDMARHVWCDDNHMDDRLLLDGVVLYHCTREGNHSPSEVSINALTWHFWRHFTCELFFHADSWYVEGT